MILDCLKLEAEVVAEAVIGDASFFSGSGFREGTGNDTVDIDESCRSIFEGFDLAITKILAEPEVYVMCHGC